MSARDSIVALKARMSEPIIGQEAMIERLLLGLLVNGNLLVEGLPGLAKTRAIKSLAKHLEAEFSRIQFTPDLLPADITGSEVYFSEAGKGEFKFQPGPVFANLVLADEVNRAPAKVQAALLEAMEEHQVTVGGKTHKLPEICLSSSRRTCLISENSKVSLHDSQCEPSRLRPSHRRTSMISAHSNNLIPAERAVLHGHAALLAETRGIGWDVEGAATSSGENQS